MRVGLLLVGPLTECRVFRDQNHALLWLRALRGDPTPLPPRNRRASWAVLLENSRKENLLYAPGRLARWTLDDLLYPYQSVSLEGATVDTAYEEVVCAEGKVVGFRLVRNPDGSPLELFTDGPPARRLYLLDLYSLRPCVAMD